MDKDELYLALSADLVRALAELIESGYPSDILEEMLRMDCDELNIKATDLPMLIDLAQQRVDRKL